MFLKNWNQRTIKTDGSGDPTTKSTSATASSAFCIKNSFKAAPQDGSPSLTTQDRN